MTLALTGKTPRRRTALVLAAFFAIIGATLGGLWAVGGANADPQPETGAVNTTTADGTVQNGNTKYENKCDVYLKVANQGNGLSPDGQWWIRVTDPNGAPVLTVSPGYFQAEVTGGQFKAYWDGTNTKVTVSNGVIPLCANGTYADTPNPGGEYKAWASTDQTFPNNDSKTDNFKVKEPTDRELKVCKVVDANGDAVEDKAEFKFDVAWDSTIQLVVSLNASENDTKSSCKTIVVPKDTSGTITEQARPNGWTDAAGYPKYQVDSGSQTAGTTASFSATTEMVTFYNKAEPLPPERTLKVCKQVDADSPSGGIFTIEVEGKSDFVTQSLEPGDDPQCSEPYTVADGSQITIKETGEPTGWVNASGYPLVAATGIDSTNSETIDVTVGDGTCGAEEQRMENPVPAADCTVTFTNKSALKPVDVVFSKYICDSYGDVPANTPGGQNDIGKNDGPTNLTHEDLGSAQGPSCVLATTPWTFNLSKSDGTQLQEVTVTGKASVTLSTDVMAYIAKAGYVEVREVYQPGYGFGALTCSGDGANDDNWEWLQLPAGTAVPVLSCTAYNVPAAGKLVIHKQITSGSPVEATTVFSGTIDGTRNWSITGTDGKTDEIVLPIGTHTVVETGATTTGWTRADGGMMTTWNSAGCPTDSASYTLTEAMVAVDKTTEVCILNTKTPLVEERTLFVNKVVLGSVVDNANVFSGTVDSAMNETWQTTNGVAVKVSGTLPPSVYHVHEDAEAGYTLKGFAVRYTGEGTVCPAAPETTGTEGIADLSTTNLVATVCVYNQPFVDINVHKTEQNGLITSDGAGWKVTLSGCGMTPETKTTDALGNAKFENKPLCATYLVSEDLTSKAPLTYFVASAYQASYAVNATTAGQTYNVLFVNALFLPPPPYTPETPETPVITPTPETPTATATQPVIIVTPTAKPTETEIVEGEKTPGQQATPIAPETGSGSGGGSGMNIVLAGIGLAAVSLGLGTIALGKRRTR